MRFNDPDYAYSYDKRLTDEGYPGDIIPLLEKHLQGCETILDIGAGSGFIAIPLAQTGYRVTAIEPSLAMIALMEEKIGGQNLPITIINKPWEDWTGRKKDAALVVHSLYPMKDTSAAVQKMVDYASLILILIRSESKSRTLSHQLRKKLSINACGKVSADNFDDILHDLGLLFEKEDFPQERSTLFTDISSEVDYYMEHLKCGESQRAIVEETIRDYCTIDGEVFNNRTIFHDVLYSIKRL